LQEVLLKWADTGKAPKGFSIKSVEWENYAREKPPRVAESKTEIERARRTLHLGQLFRSGYADLSSVWRR
jgi:hypothetical protein